MNKDGLIIVNKQKNFTPSNTTNSKSVAQGSSSTQSTATKLQITPMSPLNIQCLKNGFIDQPTQQKQNGNVLLQPAYATNNHVGVTPSQAPLANNHAQTNALFHASNITKLTNTEIQSSKDLDSKFLHQIIGNGFKAPVTDKSLDVRNTVVKKAPGGTVQITYKNMINHHSPQPLNNNNIPKSNPIFILPKPVNGIGQQVGIQTQANYHPIVTSALGKHQLIQSSVNSQPVFNTINTQQTLANETDTNVYLIDSSHQTNRSNPIMSSTPTWLVDVNHQSDINEYQSISLDSMECQQSDNPTLYSTQNDHLSSNVDMNPFNGIDIDLSCFDTEPFDALNQLYPCQSEIESFNTNEHSNDQNSTVQNFNTNNEEPYIQNFNTSASCIDNFNTNEHSNEQNFNTSNVQSNEKPPCIQQTFNTSTPSSREDVPMNIDSNVDSNVVEEFFLEQQEHATSQTQSRFDDKKLNTIQHNELKSIIDVSPEMAVCTGGIKIILIGSWNAKDARYQCRFGACCVDAELVQNGVLRCFSPKHKPGDVRLSVLCNNMPLSEEVDFTFVESNEKLSWTEKIDHDEWLTISETTLADLLVKRISFIADMVTGDETHVARALGQEAVDPTQVEDKLIDVCKNLMSQTVDINFDYKIERTMTVLHLASALGYLKLIQLLMNWVESNPNEIIQVEACPTCVDQFSLIPIMWASAKGHFTTTCVLHQWAESTIEVKDGCGCTTLSLATENGHESLVEYLGRLIKKSTISRENSMNQEQFSSSALQTSSNVNPGSVSSTISNVDDSSPRTLGKTLAFIQSMLNDQMDDLNNEEDDVDDDDASLFAAANDFVNTRQRSLTDESVSSSSQLSPASPAQNSLQSPFNRQMRETAEFCEFFYKAKKIEKDFAELTLTDQEQEELYRAANVIQTAYKAYKERRKQRDQEFSSATLIQSYYRRYKQYAAFKKMQKGAVLIQNQYRAHREKSKRKYEAASLIQNNWRRYRQRKNRKSETKLEQQAGRRVNRYLQQTTKRFSRELPDEFNGPPNIHFGTNS